MLETASGVKAFSVGKPSPVMLRAARKELALPTDQTVVIGDTMETDILGGVQLQLQNHPGPQRQHAPRRPGKVCLSARQDRAVDRRSRSHPARARVRDRFDFAFDFEFGNHGVPPQPPTASQGGHDAGLIRKHPFRNREESSRHPSAMGITQADGPARFLCQPLCSVARKGRGLGVRFASCRASRHNRGRRYGHCGPCCL